MFKKVKYVQCMHVHISKACTAQIAFTLKQNSPGKWSACAVKQYWMLPLHKTHAISTHVSKCLACSYWAHQWGGNWRESLMVSKLCAIEVSPSSSSASRRASLWTDAYLNSSNKALSETKYICWLAWGGGRRQDGGKRGKERIPLLPTSHMTGAYVVICNWTHFHCWSYTFLLLHSHCNLVYTNHHVCGQQRHIYCAKRGPRPWCSPQTLVLWTTADAATSGRGEFNSQL